MARCDVFIFLDSVQFTRRDWRTRNRIKTPQGPLWLSIPVKQRDATRTPIERIEIAEPGWTAMHLASIEHAYRRGAGFERTIGPIRDAYAKAARHATLSPVNQGLTQDLATLLGLRTQFLCDSDLLPREDIGRMQRTERLAALAAAVGATHYLSGPTARAYLDEAVLTARGIAVEWMSHEGLSTYRQLWGGYEPHLSIIDTLLNLGAEGARAALDFRHE